MTKDENEAKKYMKGIYPRALAVSFGWMTGLIHIVLPGSLHKGIEIKTSYLSEPRETEGCAWVNARRKLDPDYEQN